MIVRLAHILLTLCLILGTVAPKATAALASLGLSRGDIIVICTGEGLRTLRLDEAGEPVELTKTPEHCLLVHALDRPVQPPRPARPVIWHPIAGEWAASPISGLRLAVQNRSRAPPAA